MRTLIALFFMAVAQVEAAEPPLHHYDPVLLNEKAAASVREGDLRTAWILLERAARIAPNDAQIAANLRAVRVQLELETRENEAGRAE